MVKKTKRKSPQKKKSKKRSLSRRWIIVFILLLTFIPSFVGFYIAQKNTKQEITKETLIDEALMQKMKKMLDDERERLSNAKLDFEEDKEKIKKTQVLPPEPVIQKPKKPKKVEKVEKVEKKPQETKIVEKKEIPSEALDYKKSLKITKKKPTKKKEKVIYNGKPRLAIVIDDVSFAHHVKAIKKIPFKVTPSFFPPTSRHPNSHKFARKFKVHMVHLPLEALHHATPEIGTLLAKDSYKKIKKTVKNVKKLFPYATYYNNHTGSKFTSDAKAMTRLLKVFKEEKLHFVDSRTTADTKAADMAKKYNMKVLSRDVFLDNSYEPAAIKRQLRHAVKIAKKTGHAIAICHPHRSTLKVLANASSLLKGVDVVYIHEL